MGVPMFPMAIQEYEGPRLWPKPSQVRLVRAKQLTLG